MADEGSFINLKYLKTIAFAWLLLKKCSYNAYYQNSGAYIVTISLTEVKSLKF